MTTFSTIISSSELAEHLHYPDWIIVDCRFALNDPSRGRRDYEQSHIPGAMYAHLDEDLSGPIVSGVTGRHPLPDPQELAVTLGKWGIDSNVQVVAYDDNIGGIAARLWWLLRWLGHEKVAVLNGGWAHWESENRPVHNGIETRSPRQFTARTRDDLMIDAAAVLAAIDQPDYIILDAREAERYRGETEPIDPVAGHIPGAICVPYLENVTEDGTFQRVDALRQRFEPLLDSAKPGQVVCYCGSGVTAAHNILAIKHAGLGDIRLYAGSWSEWIADPNRPTASGPE